MKIIKESQATSDIIDEENSTGSTTKHPQSSISGSEVSRNSYNSSNEKFDINRNPNCEAGIIDSEARELINERKCEAEKVCKDYCFKSVHCVPNLARPQSEDAQHLSATIVDDAHCCLEEYIAELNLQDTSDNLPSANALCNMLDKAVEKQSTNELARIIGYWNEYNNGGEPSESKDVRYPMFSAFAIFVGIYLRRYRDKDKRAGARTRSRSNASGSLSRIARILLPNAMDRPAPCGVSGSLNAKCALIPCQPDVESVPQKTPVRGAVIAYVGFSKWCWCIDNALEKALLYSRNLFTSKTNRRFAWTLVGCAAEVYACLLIHDAVLVSMPMYLATSSGRRELVELLVNFALCDEAQLGFDPTIRYNDKCEASIIDCFDDMDGPDAKPRQYKIIDTLALSLSVVGRHTRCFVAVPYSEDGDSDDEDGSHHMDTQNRVIIKDAWNVAQFPLLEDNSSEIKLMRTIAETLESDSVNVDFLYPKMLVGGHVRVNINGISHLDSTDLIFELLGTNRVDGENAIQPRWDWWNESDRYDLSTPRWKCLPLRAHRRIVMTPLGESLSGVKTEQEVVTVLAEAMRCQSAIYKHCNILHCDISTNNILAVRDDNGKLTRGLLIDFDYGMTVDTARSSDRPKFVGTVPFMSIKAHESTDVPLTALDDWESLLYIVCWIGTIGISGDGVKAQNSAPILKWANRSVDYNGKQKQICMEDWDSFNENVLEYISEKYPLLKRLAGELYRSLFLDEDSEDIDLDNPAYLEQAAVIEEKQAIKSRTRHAPVVWPAKHIQVLLQQPDWFNGGGHPQQQAQSELTERVDPEIEKINRGYT
ncbi:hypothetical protein H4R24_005202 [Coemansia sp. RSA 988]|nr:hypothetical protein H4R24_005202 [Coemansia sp. RSA 988]